eukprot:4117857-Pleurochrysis_carterae.AAC.1
MATVSPRRAPAAEYNNKDVRKEAMQWDVRQRLCNVCASTVRATRQSLAPRPSRTPCASSTTQAAPVGRIIIPARASPAPAAERARETHAARGGYSRAAPRCTSRRPAHSRLAESQIRHSFRRAARGCRAAGSPASASTPGYIAPRARAAASDMYVAPRLRHVQCCLPRQAAPATE